MKYRTRDEWGASYDVSERSLMKGLPVSTIYIHHTVTVPTSNPDADMRNVEAIDISRFGVPSYSWDVHPSGTVLEGMGIHRGAHTMNNNRVSQNDVSFGISFMGNFQNDQPTPQALQAAGELIRDVIKPNGWLRPDWEILPHSAVFATACCGNNLRPRIGEIKTIADAPKIIPVPTPPIHLEELPMMFIILGEGWSNVADTESGMFIRNCPQFFGDDAVPVLVVGKDPNNVSGQVEAQCNEIRLRKSTA